MYSYLKEVNEDIIWQFYQPAIEYAILNEKEQGNIDEGARESL
jgi:hypothetical protein